MVDWTAEARVDEPLAQELVAGQFAPLPRRSVELLSEGWDYVVHVVDGCTWKPPPGLERVLDRAAALPPAEPLAVCHGDLHFRQLLLDGEALSGIIDWVDVCRSDPGVDLQLVWSFLTPPARDDFLDEYGPVSEASLLRARVLALYLGAILARYGHAEGLASVEAEALAGLSRAVV